MRNLKEGPGAGYTVKVSNFYGKVDSSVKRVYHNHNELFADIVQTSKSFEFNAEWSGYDWSGEVSDIKGESLALECTVNVLSRVDDAEENLIEFIQDAGKEEELDVFLIKNDENPNEPTLDSILEFLDVNSYLLTDKHYDFNTFLEKNTRNLDLGNLQIVTYEEMMGRGYSHSEMGKILSAEGKDLNMNADIEYAVTDLISFYLESSALANVVNESYEDSQDNYDDYEEATMNIELAVGQEVLDEKGNKYLSEKGDCVKLTERSSSDDADDKIKALAEHLNLDIDWDLAPEEVNDLIDDEGNNRFTYGREEYLVCTDDEADDEFKSYQQDLISEMGLDSFSENFKDYILRNELDEKAFWKDYKSSIEEDIIESPDSYSNYFDIDEMKKYILKEIDKEDVDSEYISDLGIDPDDYSDQEKGEYNYKDFNKACEEAVDDLDDDDTIKLIKDAGNIDEYSSDACDNYIKDMSAYDYLKDIYGEGKDLFKALEEYIDIDSVIEEVQKQDGRGSSLAGYDGDENEVKINGTYYFIYRTN